MHKRQKIRIGLLLVSFFLFPATFYYFSPYLIIEAAAQGIVSGSWLVFFLLLCSGLILGRGFCGWLCPAGGCQETMSGVQDRPVTRGNWLKWLIWVPWLLTLAVVSFIAGGYQQVDFFYKTSFGLSIGDVYGLITYFMVLLVLIVLPGFVVGKRSFCHHLCWMAPFMILGRKAGNRGGWPALRIAASREQCAECDSCSDHCPMSLPVSQMVQKGDMEHGECILCGTCVDGCPKKVLALVFGRASS